jgi:Tfp pilus assembly protein PilN
MMRRMIAIFGLAVAALLFSIALLGEGVVARQQQLALLQQQYQQQQEDSRHADQVHLQGEQSRIAGAVLQKFAAAGSRQLERLRRLLQLLPECAQLTAIKASASAVILSGVAADPRSLEQLPDAIFAAFAEAEQPELAAWPVLLTGSEAADFSSTGTLPGRFVLRLAFVESQRAAKAKATAFGSDS